MPTGLSGQPAGLKVEVKRCLHFWFKYRPARHAGPAKALKLQPIILPMPILHYSRQVAICHPPGLYTKRMLGSGVLVDQITRIRDEFLERQIPRTAHPGSVEARSTYLVKSNKSLELKTASMPS